VPVLLLNVFIWIFNSYSFVLIKFHPNINIGGKQFVRTVDLLKLPSEIPVRILSVLGCSVLHCGAMC